MNNQTKLKKIGLAIGLFVIILLFNLNRDGVYSSTMTVLFLPKSVVTSQESSSIAENFRQILASLAFCDRLSEQNESLAVVNDLPNYKRQEFCNAKFLVEKPQGSAMLRITNFDADSTLARELNSDVVENLIAVSGKYYNIKTDLELRIVDGPIVKKELSQNLTMTVLLSFLWTIILYGGLFLLPVIFLKKENKARPIPGSKFFQEVPVRKELTALSEEENYFSAKNFFKPTFPSFGKKAPTPANLPVSEEAVPDIFRPKEVAPEVKIEIGEVEKNNIETTQEYITREATPEEVKERLNKLLRGEK
jgi:hypothetical protein